MFPRFYPHNPAPAGDSTPDRLVTTPELRRLAVQCKRVVKDLTGGTCWVAEIGVDSRLDREIPAEAEADVHGRITLSPKLAKALSALHERKRLHTARARRNLAYAHRLLLHEALHLTGESDPEAFQDSFRSKLAYPALRLATEGTTDLVARKLLPDYFEEMGVHARTGIRAKDAIDDGDGYATPVGFASVLLETGHALGLGDERALVLKAAGEGSDARSIIGPICEISLQQPMRFGPTEVSTVPDRWVKWFLTDLVRIRNEAWAVCNWGEQYQVGRLLARSALDALAEHSPAPPHGNRRLTAVLERFNQERDRAASQGITVNMVPSAAPRAGGHADLS